MRSVMTSNIKLGLIIEIDAFFPSKKSHKYTPLFCLLFATWQFRSSLLINNFPQPQFNYSI